MPDDFSTEVAQVGDETVIHVRGEVDIVTRGPLRDTIESHLGSAEMVVIDLSEVRSMDSSCLGLLLQARGTLHAGGGSLVVRNPSEAARRLLTVARAEDLLDVDAEAHRPDSR